MLEVKATSIAQLLFPFPAYLVAEINGGYKLKDSARYFESSEQRLEAKCPFAGGWADMSAQKGPSGYVRAKVNLRLRDNSLTARVDNSHGGFHLDIERNNKKIGKARRVSLNPGKPHLLSAFEIAKKELLQRAFELLPAFDSIEQPTLDLLQRLWECKYFVNSVEVQMLLPLYPGSRLVWRFYTPSILPFRLEPGGIDLTVEPFQWEKHRST
jgi:hypothetical protein